MVQVRAEVVVVRNADVLGILFYMIRVMKEIRGDSEAVRVLVRV